MKLYIISLSIVLAGPLSGFAQANRANVLTNANPGTGQQSKLRPVDGGKTDPATGLPSRVVHEPSGIVLLLIPSGEFLMGSPPSEPGHHKAERQHHRIIRKAFYLGETEVTVGQFRRFAQAAGYKTDAERGTDDGNNHGRGSFASTPDGDRTWDAETSWRNPFPILKDFCVRDDHPVVHVSWNDAQQFCAHFKLSLPSEAQWEYACRAGSRERFPWGESEADGNGYENVGDQSRKRRFPSTNVLFPFDDGVALISPVKRYKPNSWLLHDMIGNVEEWCQDTVGTYPQDGADESPDLTKGTARILRGGSWVGNSGHTRSAARIGMTPAARRDFQGFRVAALADLTQ